MDGRVDITLLRHGVTQANVEKRYLGWSDVPLTNNGKEQLKELSNHRYPPASLLFSSDLQRCYDTAKILYPNQTITHLMALREIHFGQWELQTYDDLQGIPLYRQWLDEPKNVCPPNGESFIAFEQRVLSCWEQITKSAVQNQIEHIVIVSHGGPIRLLLTHFAPDKRLFWDWDIPFGGGYTFSTSVERIRRGERCISLQAVPLMEKASG
ncbi:histidine phosphatase family protein [Bacillus alkalicellulosilyticus]|uniref:histidine phosphatase family protein n=1 Tax=Alkalihalobacterium alkalicellulosilyticum TaxID=1912214 RepID=UPI000996F662|nr:histidine phosphatase family protein [Bacillus alkalicellulosilyticus]